MTVRSTRLAVEVLEDRTVPSTVAYADFNKDGLMDIAAITTPTTITVSLANPDGSYTVSATLAAPKNRPIQHVYVSDLYGDGNPDVVATSSQTGKDTYVVHTWLGNGDGTFDSRTTNIAKWPPPGHSGGW